eukprot:TRINITY_DN1746_c0_g1_i1.p1 TRINITY_DN1746_c0_g1~~TRINITY_DN1746_c0_g1_i1.p1  ORF type:complete len:292 (-),score=2.13 TRINITY_DN1746_c0_g1_i1:55-885(-)
MERYCRENLDFYRAVEKFKDLEGKGKAATDPDVEKFIMEIYHLFINKDGEKSVTLTGRVVEALELSLKEKKFNFTMFDLAQREAFELLKMSSVRDYLLEKIRKEAQEQPAKKRHTEHDTSDETPPKKSLEVKLTDILNPDPLFFKVIEKKGSALALLEFREFLQKEFASENIDFLLAVHSFRTSSDNRRELEKEARSIFLTYLQAGAQRELTVSADIAAKVRSHFEYSEEDTKVLPNREITKHVFDEAVDCVAHVLEYDSLQRYLIQAQQELASSS